MAYIYQKIQLVVTNEGTVLLMFLFKPHTHLFVLQGSAGTVRIGARSISRDALIVGSLGLLNVILFFIAVAIGIYCECPLAQINMFSEH